jgi:hypothetical protein
MRRSIISDHRDRCVLIHICFSSEHLIQEPLPSEFFMHASSCSTDQEDRFTCSRTSMASPRNIFDSLLYHQLAFFGLPLEHFLPHLTHDDEMQRHNIILSLTPFFCSDFTSLKFFLIPTAK